MARTEAVCEKYKVACIKIVGMLFFLIIMLQNRKLINVYNVIQQYS